MKRLIFALLFVLVVIVLASRIPETSNAQYPPPRTPVPPIPSGSHEGLRLNYANCRTSSIEWLYRAPQFEVDHFEVHYSIPGYQEYVIPAPFYWGNQDVEYWLAEIDPNLTFDHVWTVQGIGYHPADPYAPIYFTDYIFLDCTDFIIKSRIHVPGVFSK